MYHAMFVERIGQGEYDLQEMLLKIDLYHIRGKLTDDEREDLYTRARAGAVEAQAFDVQAEIRTLWAAIAELRNGTGNTGTGGDWPEYVQPAGAHDAYNWETR